VALKVAETSFVKSRSRTVLIYFSGHHTAVIWQRHVMFT